MAGFPEELANCTGFDWDKANSEKNWEKHRITRAEAEQMFFNRPLIVAPDLAHSQHEYRYAALGQTDSVRRLTAVFTIRDTLIRIVSVRDMHSRERRFYEQASKED